MTRRRAAAVSPPLPDSQMVPDALTPPIPDVDDQLGQPRESSGVFTEWGKAQAKLVFVQRLRESGNVSAAMKAAGVRSRGTLEVWRGEDQDFRGLWIDAEAEAIDSLEAAAWQRARDGVVKPVFQKGERVGEVVEYSDRLLETLLKANRPAKYNERLVDGSGLSPDESAALIRTKLLQIELSTDT